MSDIVYESGDDADGGNFSFVLLSVVVDSFSIQKQKKTVLTANSSFEDDYSVLDDFWQRTEEGTEAEPDAIEFLK